MKSNIIPFNKPPFTGNENQYVFEAISSSRLCGDGSFSHKCQTWFEGYLGSQKTLLTPSCTASLEMSAILADIVPGDEVIMPSYTFVSTANAFALRGAKIIFVDIRPDTMNIDEKLIEAAISDKTKAIVPVHYAGVSCDMDAILDIANRFGLIVIEDAAQGILSYFNQRPVGSCGHLAAFSFHETKNCTSGGEGGLLAVNDKRFIQRAEIIREKGTNRSQFFRGQIDKYSWVDIGSSYLPSELQAAYLWGQLEKIEYITQRRLSLWNKYYYSLLDLQKKGLLDLPAIPVECKHNAHIFYLKVKDCQQRSALIEFLKERKVQAVFHYVPLHSSPAGKVFGKFFGNDQFTTFESERLIRLPIYYGMTLGESDQVIEAVNSFFLSK